MPWQIPEGRDGSAEAEEEHTGYGSEAPVSIATAAAILA